MASSFKKNTQYIFPSRRVTLSQMDVDIRNSKKAEAFKIYSSQYEYTPSAVYRHDAKRNKKAEYKKGK